MRISATVTQNDCELNMRCRKFDSRSSSKVASIVAVGSLAPPARFVGAPPRMPEGKPANAGSATSRASKYAAAAPASVRSNGPAGSTAMPKVISMPRNPTTMNANAVQPLAIANPPPTITPSGMRMLRKSRMIAASP